MRLITYILALLLVLCFATAYVAARDITLAWDHPGTDVTGAAETVAAGEIVIYRVGDTPDDAIHTDTFPIVDFVEGQPQGLTHTVVATLAPAHYMIAVRVFDKAGNASIWEPTAEPLDLSPPAGATNVRVTVTVEVIAR